MGTHKITCTWEENYQFSATDHDGHELVMDIGTAAGGDNAGFKPMPMLLVGLGGCMGVDVKLVLNKMRVELDALRLEISGVQDEESTPKIYKSITINFHFKGKDLQMSKLEKAIKLAEEKYCNVSAILSRTAQLEYKAIID